MCFNTAVLRKGDDVTDRGVEQSLSDLEHETRVHVRGRVTTVPCDGGEYLVGKYVVRYPDIRVWRRKTE